MRRMKQIVVVDMARWGKNLVREFAKFSKVKTCVSTD